MWDKRAERGRGVEQERGGAIRQGVEQERGGEESGFDAAVERMGESGILLPPIAQLCHNIIASPQHMQMLCVRVVRLPALFFEKTLRNHRKT